MNSSLLNFPVAQIIGCSIGPDLGYSDSPMPISCPHRRCSMKGLVVSSLESELEGRGGNRPLFFSFGLQEARLTSPGFPTLHLPLFGSLRGLGTSTKAPPNTKCYEKGSHPSRRMLLSSLQFHGVQGITSLRPTNPLSLCSLKWPEIGQQEQVKMCQVDAKPHIGACLAR